MKAITDYSSEDLNALLKDLQIQYQEARAQNLNLNMARGKPAAAQLDLSNELLNRMGKTIPWPTVPMPQITTVSWKGFPNADSSLGSCLA